MDMHSASDVAVRQQHYIRASVDALYRDGANVRGDAHMLKASMLRECVNMSLLRHLVKLYKAY